MCQTQNYLLNCCFYCTYIKVVNYWCLLTKYIRILYKRLLKKSHRDHAHKDTLYPNKFNLIIKSNLNTKILNVF